MIGKKIANNKSAYRYLEESIDFFPNQKNLLEFLNKTGFSETRYLNLFKRDIASYKKIITERFELEKINDAIELMKSGKSTGRILIEM